MNRGACSGESGQRCWRQSKGPWLGSPGSDVCRGRAAACGSQQGGRAVRRHLRRGGRTENLSSEAVSRGLSICIWAT